MAVIISKFSGVTGQHQWLMMFRLTDGSFYYWAFEEFYSLALDSLGPYCTEMTEIAASMCVYQKELPIVDPGLYGIATFFSATGAAAYTDLANAKVEIIDYDGTSHYSIGNVTAQTDKLAFAGAGPTT